MPTWPDDLFGFAFIPEPNDQLAADCAVMDHCGDDLGDR
jgi:hypothetical protein